MQFVVEGRVVVLGCGSRCECRAGAAGFQVSRACGADLCGAQLVPELQLRLRGIHNVAASSGVTFTVAAMPQAQSLWYEGAGVSGTDVATGGRAEGKQGSAQIEDAEQKQAGEEGRRT
jgi:hypothetical protein